MSLACPCAWRPRGWCSITVPYGSAERCPRSPHARSIAALQAPTHAYVGRKGRPSSAQRWQSVAVKASIGPVEPMIVTGWPLKAE